MIRSVLETASIIKGSCVTVTTCGLRSVADTVTKATRGSSSGFKDAVRVITESLIPVRGSALSHGSDDATCHMVFEVIVNVALLFAGAPILSVSSEIIRLGSAAF